MKKAFITITLLVATAFAQAAGVIATAPNKAGGAIKLTDVPCEKKPGMATVYTTNNKGDGFSLLGCWTLFDDNIIVFWSDGTSKVFDIDDFILRPNPKAKKSRPEI